MVGRDRLIIKTKLKYFTVENLINKLVNDLGQSFRDLIINKKKNEINPEILIFVDNKEIQTLKNLNTPLSDGNQIVFLSSIHGGFKMRT